MDIPSGIDSENLAAENSLARAERIWTQKHPNRRLGRTEGTGTDNAAPTRLRNEFNEVQMLKIGTLTKMILYRQNSHQ
ncbi:MAG: hypothetical protein U0518_00045 [Candidatus Gracilibacteria bacterium]